MAISFPVIILVLIAVIVGIAIGYFMAQKRLQQETDVIQGNHQKRLQALEIDHERRLSDALFRARQDYEAQLANHIGHYQDQLSQREAEREQEHQTRFEVWRQGIAASNGASSAGVSAPTAAAPEVMQLKHQYESRLREAAQKLQQAYEQKLAQQAQAVTHDLQQVYENKLAQKIAHYETQLAERVTQLESEFEARQAAIFPGVDAEEIAPELEVDGPDDRPGDLSGVHQASPSEIMGIANNEPTITLHRSLSLIDPDPAQFPEGDVPNLNALDALDAVPPARQSESEGQPAGLAEPQEQFLADLAELDEIPSLSKSNNPDPLADLADFSQITQTSEPAIEIEQLDSLDLDDIGQLS
jgi:hypothetical protein